MPIYKGLRYENTPVYGYLDPNKGYTPTIGRRSLFKTPYDAEFIQYQVKSGDTLDYLAYKYLDGPNDWWIILDCNPQFFTPMDIKPGDIILIPTSDTKRRGIDGL